MSSGIYKYTNLIDNKIYIGQSNDLSQRNKAHVSAVTNVNSNEYNSELSRAIRKNGIENFSYEILAIDIFDRNLLNLLEEYYIDYYDCISPKGYNKTRGGNYKTSWDKNQREKFSFEKGKLTLEEVQDLRIAYKNGKSSTEIYKAKYKNRLTWGGFINIWRGVRYSHIMPEVFENKRKRTKLTEEKVKQIREKYSSGQYEYKDLAQEYEVSNNTIGDIINYKTWKNI